MSYFLKKVVSLSERTMAMNNRFYWLILILILGSIALGACTAPAAKPTATAPGGFPVGTYKPDQMLYTDMIKFSADSTFVAELPGDRHLGHYEVSGDQIVLNTYDGVCLSHPGTYHWEIHGNTLLLKPINETCTESSRSEDLGGRSWILQP